MAGCSQQLVSYSYTVSENLYLIHTEGGIEMWAKVQRVTKQNVDRKVIALSYHLYTYSVLGCHVISLAPTKMKVGWSEGLLVQ